MSSICCATVVRTGNKFSTAVSNSGDTFMVHPDREAYVVRNRYRPEPFLAEFREQPSELILMGDEIVVLPGIKKPGTPMIPAVKWAFASSWDACQKAIDTDEAEKAKIQYRIVGNRPADGNRMTITQGNLREIEEHLKSRGINLNNWNHVRWFQLHLARWVPCAVPYPFRFKGQCQTAKSEPVVVQTTGLASPEMPYQSPAKVA